MRKVSDGLYVGGIESLRQELTEIDRLVSLTAEFRQTDFDRPILDSPDHEYQKFAEAVDYVRSSIENNYTVLVFCQRGQSRSVSVATAALAVSTDVSLYESLEKCRSESTPPNAGLLESVIKYVDQCEN